MDTGSRGAVTAGKNMDGFASIMIDLVNANGLTDAAIIRDGRIPLTLPGYFRPTKSWDLLVLRENRLIAALELKSQVGSLPPKPLGECAARQGPGNSPTFFENSQTRRIPSHV